jgi:hypothetical protein
MKMDTPASLQRTWTGPEPRSQIADEADAVPQTWNYFAHGRLCVAARNSTIVAVRASCLRFGGSGRGFFWSGEYSVVCDGIGPGGMSCGRGGLMGCECLERLVWG